MAVYFWEQELLIYTNQSLWAICRVLAFTATKKGSFFFYWAKSRLLCFLFLVETFHRWYNLCFLRIWTIN